MAAKLKKAQLPPGLPALPDDWDWKPLGDKVDATRGICYGIVQPGPHDPLGVPMVNSQDVFDGSVNESISFQVSEKLNEQFSRSQLRGDEVLITLVGANFGRVAVAPRSYAGYNCARPVGMVPVRGDSQFISFALRTPLVRGFMDTWANTTAQPTLNLGDVANLPIAWPKEKSVRDGIAESLSAIEDKIELNRRMNRTLEAMAQAIFKSWFVDFEPVKAKAAAKAAGATPVAIERAAMAAIAGRSIEEAIAQESYFDDLIPSNRESLAQTAALFPDTFQDSELGEIPEGWSAVGFDKLATLDTTSVKPFNSPTKVWEHYSIPSFDASNLPAWETGASIKSNKYIVKSGAILSSKLNPQFPRTWWPPLFDRKSAICSTEFMQFVPVDAAEQAFIYGLTTSAPFQAGIAERVTGSTGSRQRAQPKQIATMTVLDSGSPLRKEFVRVTHPLYEKTNTNLVESRTLAQLRDALLPKLLSGEIEIPELERRTS